MRSLEWADGTPDGRRLTERAARVEPKGRVALLRLIRVTLRQTCHWMTKSSPSTFACLNGSEACEGRKGRPPQQLRYAQKL